MSRNPMILSYTIVRTLYILLFVVFRGFGNLRIKMMEKNGHPCCAYTFNNSLYFQWHIDLPLSLKGHHNKLSCRYVTS
jgi:hypothetical protein